MGCGTPENTSLSSCRRTLLGGMHAEQILYDFAAFQLLIDDLHSFLSLKSGLCSLHNIFLKMISEFN